MCPGSPLTCGSQPRGLRPSFLRGCSLAPGQARSRVACQRQGPVGGLLRPLALGPPSPQFQPRLAPPGTFHAVDGPASPAPGGGISAGHHRGPGGGRQRCRRRIPAVAWVNQGAPAAAVRTLLAGCPARKRACPPAAGKCTGAREEARVRCGPTGGRGFPLPPRLPQACSPVGTSQRALQPDPAPLPSLHLEGRSS